MAEKKNPASPLQHIRTPSPTTSLESAERHEQYSYPDRGHKANFLLKPLPNLPNEDVEQK